MAILLVNDDENDCCLCGFNNANSFLTIKYFMVEVSRIGCSFHFNLPLKSSVKVNHLIIEALSQ